MADSADATERARFAAREFLAKWQRETGETNPVIADRILFAFEMGYLRGRTDGAAQCIAMLEGRDNG